MWKVLKVLEVVRKACELFLFRLEGVRKFEFRILFRPSSNSLQSRPFRSKFVSIVYGNMCEKFGPHFITIYFEPFLSEHTLPKFKFSEFRGE